MAIPPAFRGIETTCQHCGAPSVQFDGASLRERRMWAGVSMRALARRIGVSVAYLCDIEHNRRHRVPRIVEAYEALAAEGGE